MGKEEEELLEAAAKGELKAVKQILSDEEVDTNATDQRGNASLHRAVQNGFPEIATLLLEAGCDVDKQNEVGETALLLAARVGDLETVQILLQFGADKRIKDNNGRTPFFVAMSASHSEVAAELLPGESSGLKQGDATPRSFFGTTDAAGNGGGEVSEEKRLETAKREEEQHLRDAAEAGDIVGVKELLKLSPEIDIDALDDQGHTALYRAAIYGRTQVVEYLLKQGANADVRDMDGKTPLHVAATRGYGRITRRLLEKTENRNMQDLLGATPLFSAAESGSTDVLKALLDYNADPNIPNNNEETPLWAATANGHESFVRVLLEESFPDGTEVEVDAPGVLRGQAPLHLAAQRGDTQIASLLLEHGARKDLRDSSGCTALFIAADMGRTRMVAFLLDQGVSLNAANHHGETALYVAALDGHVKVTEELLQRGADTEVADVNGQTPLMSAAQEGHTAIISELLQASAKVKAANNIGETPLMIAALEGYQNAVALLIENGADIKTARNDGKTALHMAAMDGHTGAVNVLLSTAKTEFEATKKKKKAAPLFSAPLHLTTDTQGETALHLATRFRQVSAMQLLLDYDVFFHKILKRGTIYGKLVEVPNKFGWTALHVAVDRAHRGAVDLLLDQKANVNAADIFGNTPIHLAARGIDHRILLELLSVKGARGDAVNVEGKTPLHFASACVRPTSATFLLNRGANVQAADVFEKQPLDVLGNVGVCNPKMATEKELCDFEKHRPDMCPITLGNKNALIETEVLLQVAVKNQNETELCFGPCSKPPSPESIAIQKPTPQESMSSTDTNSVQVPVYGLLIPAAIFIILLLLGLYCLFWKRGSKEGTISSATRQNSLFSKRRLKQKQYQAELDRVESSVHSPPPVHRKSTFEAMKAILSEPYSSKHDHKTSGSGTSESGSSCGWSDASDNEHEAHLQGCSSGEQTTGRCSQTRIMIHNDSVETDYLSK